MNEIPKYNKKAISSTKRQKINKTSLTMFTLKVEENKAESFR